MRRALLAFSFSPAPLVLAAAPAGHAAGPALVVHYYKDHTLANGGSLDAGTSDGQFEFVLTLSSEGDSQLDIGAITVPGNFNVIYDPSNTSVPSGATATLRLRCMSTGSGPLTIPSNDSAGNFTATLSCSQDGTGGPSVEVRTDGDDLLLNGSGSMSLNAGASSVVWIYNTGDGTANLNLFPASAAPAGIQVGGFYVFEPNVPSGGMPSYLEVRCKAPVTDAPVAGDFVISIPVGAWESYYTFTLHCIATDDGSLADNPTGSGLTMWGSALAALLLAAGGAMWLTSRRNATVR